MKLGLCLITMTALLGCHPLDRSIYTNKELLEMGRLVEFTEPGYRYKGCRKSDPDWVDLRLYDQSERARVVLGKQSSIVGTGRKTCFRVGSSVLLKVFKDTHEDLGLARITRIAWVKLNRLSSDHLRGRHFRSPSVLNALKDSLQKRMTSRDDGIVTIVDFSYLNGSAVDEKSIIDDDAKQKGPIDDNSEVK